MARTTSTELWTRYHVHLRVDRLVGGIPAHEKPLQAWLDANEAPAEGRAEQAAMVTGLEEQTHTNIFSGRRWTARRATRRGA